MEGIVKFGDEKLKFAFENLKDVDKELYDQIDKPLMKSAKMYFVEETSRKILFQSH